MPKLKQPPRSDDIASTAIGRVPDEIYNTIVDAILDRALDPGTKLPEEVFCRHYGVSRTIVRVAIHRLEQDRLVEVQRNRGCFVVTPDRSEARDILAARKAVEPYIVKRLASSATDAEIDLLAKQTDSEDEAYHRRDDREALRRSGQFHLLLGHLAKSQVIEVFLRNLICRSALVIATYSEVTGCCRAHDHRALVEMLRKSEVGAAASLMERHLDEIEKDLLSHKTSDEKPKLESVLAQYSGRHAKGVNVKSVRR